MSDVFLVTMDLNWPNVSVRMDLHNLGFRDACFDLILCSHVLEHVYDDRACMAELHRVLKPGGIGFFPVPIYEEGKTVEFGVPQSRLSGHVRSYGADYFDRLARAGFDLIPGKESVVGVIRPLGKKVRF